MKRKWEGDIFVSFPAGFIIPQPDNLVLSKFVWYECTGVWHFYIPTHTDLPRACKQMDWLINVACVCAPWPPYASHDPPHFEHRPILAQSQILHRDCTRHTSFPSASRELNLVLQNGCFGFDAQVFVAPWRHLLVKKWPIMSSENLVCQTSCDFVLHNAFPCPSGRHTWNLMDSYAGCDWHDCWLLTCSYCSQEFIYVS